MAVMAVADTAKFTVERLNRRVFYKYIAGALVMKRRLF